ncbi:unnamed protein product [Closterium sp. NIES-64]|nr:unnamed protein product [Closterium sp. NIES-65]CAI6002802.1 unnamed protein product [Closterium sp. NIES-64]
MHGGSLSGEAGLAWVGMLTAEEAAVEGTSLAEKVACAGGGASADGQRSQGSPPREVWLLVMGSMAVALLCALIARLASGPIMCRDGDRERQMELLMPACNLVAHGAAEEGEKEGGGRMEGRERVEKGERKGDGKGDVEREGKKATPTAQLSLSLSLSPHSHTARTFQSAASMTATSSRPASAHIASCSAALVTRTHAATLSPPAPYTAAPLRVTTRNPVLPRGNAWRMGAGEGGRRGRTRGRRGEVER